MANSMANRLQDNNSSDPSVNEVVGVERDPEKRDQWIVSDSKKEKRNHIGDRKHARPIAEFGKDLTRRAVPVNGPDRETNVSSEENEKEDRLESCGNDTGTTSRPNLEMFIVPDTHERSQ